MYSPLHITLKYIGYRLTAKNGKGHGIHSPFVFQLVQKVLNAKHKDSCFQKIESLRKNLLKDQSRIEIEDYGAGSVKGFNKERIVKEIASTSLKKPKYAQMLFRLAQFTGAEKIIELGTSLGITTAYLSMTNPNAEVFSFEGAPSLVQLARHRFASGGFHNIEVIAGSFDQTIPDFLQNHRAVPDLIYIDGNHTYEATIRYFKWFLPVINEHTVMVFDDIHWSEGMEKAWKEIMADASVTLTIDLFFMGIVFFRKSQLTSQHFTIRF